MYRTAKVWEDRKCVHVLKGHKNNVLCVLSLSNGCFATGCGDGTVKLWDAQTGNEIKSIVASTTCVRGLLEMPGIGFLTVANDGMLKTWTLQGDCVFEIQAHTNLVYSLVLTKSGEIVTSSEDKTVKIWKDGQLVQTIEHPACVWKVALLDNGDLATACADSIARVFTRSSERIAEAEIIQSFNDAIANSKIKKGNVDPSTLPGVGALKQPGKKNGEIKLVSNSGVPEAWSWNAQKGEWEKMGDVVEGPGVGSGFADKVHYEGKMYDYVFDIELEDPGSGTRTYKLPYNRGDNPFMAAQEFIWKYDISQYYLDRIAQFIIQNSDQSNAMQLDNDPLTGHQTYVPKPNSSKATKTELSDWEKEQLKLKKEQEERDRQKSIVHFPSKEIMFDQANTEGIIKKLKEFNNQFKSSQADIALSDSEWDMLMDWVDSIKTLDYKKITANHFTIIDRKLLKWPHKNLFPVIDLLRLIVLTPPGAKHYAQEFTEHNYDIMAEMLSIVKQNYSDNVLNMLFMRFAANMLVHNSSIALRHVTDLNRLITSFAKSDNKNIQMSLATLLLNLCVHYRARTGPEAAQVQDTLLANIATMLSIAIDHALIYRLLVAAGTLLDGSTLELRKKAEQYKIVDFAQQHTSSPTPQVHGVAFRLRSLFKRQ
jgi:phospholipase A-2-activating protein